MTLPRGTGRALYAGNGQAVEFPFFFKVWEEEQLSVHVTSPGGVTAPATGWTATLDEDGGTVRYLHEGAPLPEGWKLAIMRNMPFVQEVDLVTGTRFDPEVIETALDMAAAERQQLLERLGRAVVVEPTDERGPEALVGEIRSARDRAVASAAGAAGSETAARAAQAGAAASANTAVAQMETACLCAQRAEAAAEAARESPDLAKTTEVLPPTATRRGGIRAGNGLILVAGADGVEDVLEPVAGLAVSRTEGAVAAKAVEVTGLTPHAGARLCLMLAETNTAEAPTLAVNPAEGGAGGSPLPILWAGAAPLPGELAGGLPYLLVCDGSSWQVTGSRPDGGYELCEPYPFLCPVLKSGFQPAQGGIIVDAAAKYPQARAYLQTPRGRQMCVTEEEWQAMTQAAWGEGAFQASWEGIGGAPKYVQDLNAGTLRLPDLRGMVAMAAGDGVYAPEAGQAMGDRTREVMGETKQIRSTAVANDIALTTGAFEFFGKTMTQGASGEGASSAGSQLRLKSSNVVPTGARNIPASFGVLMAVYLGRPAA